MNNYTLTPSQRQLTPSPSVSSTPEHEESAKSEFASTMGKHGAVFGAEAAVHHGLLAGPLAGLFPGLFEVFSLLSESKSSRVSDVNAEAIALRGTDINPNHINETNTPKAIVATPKNKLIESLEKSRVANAKEAQKPTQTSSSFSSLKMPWKMTPKPKR